jgi:hypothetical protein
MLFPFMARFLYGATLAGLRLAGLDQRDNILDRPQLVRDACGGLEAFTPGA